MQQNHDPYATYTEAAVLPYDGEIELALEWAKRYFKYTYADLLPADLGCEVVEIGCGIGRYVQAMAELGYTKVRGIDLSAQQVYFARDRLGLANVEQADGATWLSGRPSSFDCVLALDVLEHLQLEDLIELGRSIRAALRSGGIAIFQVPNGLSPMNQIVFGDLTHVRAFSPRSMNQFFVYAGMEAVAFLEIPPAPLSLKTRVQRALWFAFTKPILRTAMMLIQGRTWGGAIYTPNFIAVCKKR